MRQHTNTADFDVRRAEESVGVRSQSGEALTTLAASAIRIARAAASIHMAHSAGLPSNDDPPTEQTPMCTSQHARERWS